MWQDGNKLIDFGLRLLLKREKLLHKSSKNALKCGNKKKTKQKEKKTNNFLLNRKKVQNFLFIYLI